MLSNDQSTIYDSWRRILRAPYPTAIMKVAIIIMMCLIYPTLVSSSEGFVMNRSLFEIHYNAIHMSYLAYSTWYDPTDKFMIGFPFDTDINFTNIDPWYGNQNNYVKFYEDEPELAVLAKIKGRCYVSFRGSAGDRGNGYSDTQTNLQPGQTTVCPSNTSKQCCTVRKGFHDAYYNIAFRPEMESDIQFCYEKTQCYIQQQLILNNTNTTDVPPPTDCVVYTGHSQGASIAASGALYHYKDWNPVVVNFAWPKNIYAGCEDQTEIVDFSRWYAYMNTRKAFLGVTRLYDLVPNLLSYPGVKKYGHLFLLSEDYTGVAYIGFNSQRVWWRKVDFTLRTHNVGTYGTYRGLTYIQRFNGIMSYIQQTALSNNDTTVTGDASAAFRTAGFLNGSPCEYNEECQSSRCARRFFLNPLSTKICK